MTLAVDLMFCEAAVARAVARVAAWGELAGGDPAAKAIPISTHTPLAHGRHLARQCMHCVSSTLTENASIDVLTSCMPSLEAALLGSISNRMWKACLLCKHWQWLRLVLGPPRACWPALWQTPQPAMEHPQLYLLSQYSEVLPCRLCCANSDRLVVSRRHCCDP